MSQPERWTRCIHSSVIQNQLRVHNPQNEPSTTPQSAYPRRRRTAKAAFHWAVILYICLLFPILGTIYLASSRLPINTGIDMAMLQPSKLSSYHRNQSSSISNQYIDVVNRASQKGPQEEELVDWWRQEKNRINAPAGASFPLVPLFYHLSTQNMDNLSVFEKIMGEQLKHMAKEIQPAFTVSLTTVGPENVSHYLREFKLPRRSIIHRITNGTQLHTLNQIWTFCKAENDTDQLVMYLHGENYMSEWNASDLVRQLATHGAFQCAYKMVNEKDNVMTLARNGYDDGNMNVDTCDTCSMRMSAQPYPHSVGNMWVAKCSYVRSLTDPFRFATIMHAEDERNEDDSFPDEKQEIKKDYDDMRVAQRWIHSHPIYNPCDIYPDSSFKWADHGLPESLPSMKDHFQIQPAPRFETLGCPTRTGLLDEYRETRFIEYMLLYNQTPVHDWWGWEFMGSASENDNILHQQKRILESRNNTVSHEPTLTIFYNLFTHATDTQLQQRAFSVLEEQMGDLGRWLDRTKKLVHDNELPFRLNPSTIVPLKYITIGKEVNVSMYCPKGVECTPITHLNTGHEGRILAELYTHCHSNPNGTVLYFHSKGSFHDIAAPGFPQHHWRRWMLASITAKECLSAVSNDQCDLCGLHFFVQFNGPIIPGNFFTARCSYINQLILPDSKLEGMMDSLFTLSWMGEFDSYVKAKGKMDPIGLGGRFAYEAWTGSSPSLRPCDMSSVSDIRYYWNTSIATEHGDRFDLLNFSHSPSFPFTERYVFDELTRKDSLLKGPQADRLRYFYFLSGNLLKYFLLYKRYPPDSSWVWTFFPDGDYWKKKVKEVGPRMLPFRQIFREAGLSATTLKFNI